MDKFSRLNAFILFGMLLLCTACSTVGFSPRSDSTFISAEAPLQQAGVYVYLNGTPAEVKAALEYIRRVEIYDAAAGVWLPLERPAEGERAHPEGQGFVAGGYLAPGEYPRLRLHGGDETEAQVHELASGIERLNAGVRTCVFLWGEGSTQAQEASSWTWHAQTQRTPISGDQLALLSADGTEVQLLRTDNLHTSAALGLHERWRDWLLRADEGIWGLSGASMTLRDRDTWRVQDRLGLPLVQEAAEFAVVESQPFGAGGGADPATFFISDPAANRVVSITRDGGRQQVYAAGYAPQQVESHHYATSFAQTGALVLIAADDGLYLLDSRSNALRRHSGNWRINDIAGAETQIFVALQHINEVRSYTLPEFSLSGRFAAPATAQNLLVLRNHLVVACATSGGGELIWLSPRDMTRMGQMPLPFAVGDTCYSPVTRNIYVLSRDGEHLLQIDSVGRRIVTRVDLPRRARELLLVEHVNTY
jgi:hypothetical protein